ncbi:MAG: CoA pyrophosphatase [Gammaproteobacteria bacterium]|nr:CoA pyrophosphatase [Gammaproteobacteria bacterium]
MERLSITEIEARIRKRTEVSIESGDRTREAAVAAILREGRGVTEALFILRATKEGDPWSGHMAFPGGHRDPPDRSLRHTAERETLEEIGLDLTRHARFVGEIEPVRANPASRNIDMVVVPFVYVLETDDPLLTPNYEVADILWGCLDEMFDGSCFTHDEFEIGGQSRSVPGYVVGEHIVWGLTLRMLEKFFGMLDPSFESHDF